MIESSAITICAVTERWPWRIFWTYAGVVTIAVSGSVIVTCGSPGHRSLSFVLLLIETDELRTTQPEPVRVWSPAVSVQKMLVLFPSRQVRISAVDGSVNDPAVVFAEVGAGVMPVQVPLSRLIFIVVSFALIERVVKTMDVDAPETAEKYAIRGCAANAVLPFPAQVAAVSALTTATETVIGDPVRPRAVTITVALPDPDIVPAAVAVSACAVPIICGVMKSPDPTRSTEYCGGSARFWLSVYLSTTIPSQR